MDSGPVGVLQCQMYGLRKVFKGFKGPGKDLLETSLSDSDSISQIQGNEVILRNP